MRLQAFLPDSWLIGKQDAAGDQHASGLSTNVPAADHSRAYREQVLKIQIVSGQVQYARIPADQYVQHPLMNSGSLFLIIILHGTGNLHEQTVPVIQKRLSM